MENPHSFGQILGTSTLLVFALSFNAYNIQASEKNAFNGGDFLYSQPKVVAVQTNLSLASLKSRRLALVKGYTVMMASETNVRGAENENATSSEGLHLGSSLNGDNRDKKSLSASTIDTACLITAIDKRDAAILTAIDSYSTAVKTALSTRTTALNAAWTLTDRTARRAALKKLWSDFRNSTLKARKDLNKAKRSAWNAWIIDKKVCAPHGVPDDPANSSIDAYL